MRRLPIYFVIDVSESMIGDPILQVEDGIRMIVGELKRDPYALETAYFSIIVFAGVAQTLVPLTDIVTFSAPRFSIGGGTSYAKALDHLVSAMESDLVATTVHQKGDWKPIIYFMTDGSPTDDCEAALSKWEKKYRDKTNVVVVSIGDNADHSMLRRISNNVLAFDDSRPEAFKEFFKWVTGSIKTQSQKVDHNAGDDEIELGGSDRVNLKKVPPGEQPVRLDDRYVIFHGRCQNTKKDYLIKYMRKRETGNFGGMAFNVVGYRLTGAFRLDETYQQLSDRAYKIKKTISTDELTGFPACPCCGNQVAISICACGNIFCVDGEGVHTCPWCNLQGQYGRGRGSLDINRELG